MGEADNGRDAVEMALKLKPAVVLMDIMMPQLNGFRDPAPAADGRLDQGADPVDTEPTTCTR